MRVFRFTLLGALSLLILPFLAGAEPVSLFNGKTLEGWEGDTAKVWRVEDGAIVGGSMEGNPQNEFLTTKKSYRNFRLKLDYKLVGTEGFVNGGVQIRSRRIENPPNEMSGYQADIGAGHTGSLYDESRRKRFLARADKAQIEALEKPGEWNTYEIICEGPRVQLRLNGRQTLDYTERENGIEQDGLIALQIHGNCKAVISFRNITIEEFDDDLVPEERQVLQRFGNPRTGTEPIAPFTDARFTLSDGEVVVFIGQANFVREQQAGELEARLLTAHVAQKPRFRFMAWEGDTVYEQWRDTNFGSWSSQLDAAGATALVVQFGQVEALDGLGRLPEFTAAYHRLLDELARSTRRLVLVSPMPFERPLASHAPDLSKRNDDVRAYAAAVREIARARGAVFVNLFGTLEKQNPGGRLTDNGMHLNAAGLPVVAAAIATSLGAGREDKPNPELLKAIAEKNRLWFDCWRPANWNFVYGDRATQLFATATGEEPSLREVFEHHKPLIAKMDARIEALARGEKLPAISAPEPAVQPQAPQLTPEEQLATFTVADGFEVSLFASEKDGVVKPTQISWDERGRLYVACSPTYPHLTPGAKPGDYILVLEDTDGDGKADKSWKFTEGLRMVQGVEPGDGGLYVCDFTELVHLRDTNGDGRADERRVIFSGFGTGDTHQLINSISHGPDGSLWFTQGLHIFSRVETPWGLSRLDRAGVWRLNPRQLRLDAFFSGGRAGHNCWGVAFDDYGQVFHKTGDRPDGYYTVPGMVRFQYPEEYHGRGSIFQTAAKTTSLDIIGTRALPQDLQGCAVVAGFMKNTIDLYRFIDDGSGFKTKELPKLLTSSSEAFRPVDVAVGPDGAIYAADWFNKVIGHYQASYRDPQRDKANGRIWRIRAIDRPAVKQPNLTEMKPAELLEQLHSSERWTRAQAKRLLFDSPSEEVIAAADAWTAKLDVAKEDYERLLLEVIGVYQAHESVQPALLEKLLTAHDARVRAYGTRVLGLWADRLPEVLAKLRRSVRDEHPRVRLEAIVASSYVATPKAVEVATESLKAPADRFINYALPLAVKALQSQWAEALNSGALTFGGDEEQAKYVRAIAGARPAIVHPGKNVYDTLCLNCHQADGRGLAGVYPPIADSEWVRGDKSALIKMLLHGLTGPITVAGKQYGVQAPVPMPASGLADEHIAQVITYIRSNFGHQASEVTAAEVAAIRAAHAGRREMWTPEELGAPQVEQTAQR